MDVASAAGFLSYEFETEILPSKNTSVFSHGLGQSETPKHVRSDGSFPRKRSLGAGDGCTADHCQPGYACASARPKIPSNLSSGAWKTGPNLPHGLIRQGTPEAHRSPRLLSKMFICCATCNVQGTAVTSRPPHRSRRALLTHRAPPSGRMSAARGLKPPAVRRTDGKVLSRFDLPPLFVRSSADRGRMADVLRLGGGGGFGCVDRRCLWSNAPAAALWWP
jgi:hypothetical protein